MATTSFVVIEADDNLKAAPSRASRGIIQALIKAAELTLTEAKAEAPVDSGNLRDNLERSPIVQVGPLTFETSIEVDPARVGYLLAVIRGWPDEMVITAKDKKFKFFFAGREIIRSQITLPPREPNPFGLRAVQRVSPKVKEVVGATFIFEVAV